MTKQILCKTCSKTLPLEAERSNGTVIAGVVFCQLGAGRVAQGSKILDINNPEDTKVVLDWSIGWHRCPLGYVAATAGTETKSMGVMPTPNRR